MDPNRYAKNRNIRPDGPWQVLIALVSLSLMILGIVGTAVHLFGSKVRLDRWLHWAISEPIHIILVLLGAIALLFSHQYITRISDEKHRAASNFPMYMMMLVGVYFAYQLLTTGNW